MKRTNPLKRAIERIAAIYNDGRRVRVTWTSQTPHADTGGRYIAINPKSPERWTTEGGPSQFRILSDTTSHEVEHIRSSDLRSKAKMRDGHPDAPTVAGTIANVLEDVYIDDVRTDRFPGMKAPMAHVVSMWADKRPDPADMGSTTLRYWEVFQQVAFTGTSKSLDDLDDGLQRWAEWVADRTREVRQTHVKGDRYDLFCEVYDKLAELVDIEALESRVKGIDIRAILGPDYDPSDMWDEELPESPPDVLPPKSKFDPESDGGDMDTRESIVDWWELPPARRDNFDEPDSTYEAKFVQIRKEELTNIPSLDERVADRQDKLDSATVPKRSDHHSSVIRDIIEKFGIADEVAEFFRLFKQADAFVSTDRGDRINVDAAIDAAAGVHRDELFFRSEKMDTGNRTVAVSLDTSGSMGGPDVIDAKTALGALYLATQEIGDEFVANAWRSPESMTTESGESGRRPDLTLIKAPEEEFRWEYLDAVATGGTDPITVGMADAKALMDLTAARQQILFVVHDGAPHVCAGLSPDADYGEKSSTKSVDEAAAYVRDLRRDGVIVIGIGVEGGVDENVMEQIFDDAWRVVDVQDLSDTLLELYTDALDVER